MWTNTQLYFLSRKTNTSCHSPCWCCHVKFHLCESEASIFHEKTWNTSFNRGLGRNDFSSSKLEKKPSRKRRGFFSSLELEKSFLPLKILKQTKTDVNGIPKNQCICPDFSRCPFSRQKSAVQSGSKARAVRPKFHSNLNINFSLLHKFRLNC